MTNKRAATGGSHDEPIHRLVRQWRWFDYVPDEGVSWLVERIQVRRFDAGTLVYLAGDEVDAIFGVLSGAFRIFIDSKAGVEITLEESVPGTWFAHYLPSHRPVHAASCICRRSATVAAVPLAVLNQFAEMWPGYYRGVYHEFMDRVEAILGRIELLSVHKLEVRLAVYLVRMTHLRGKPCPDGTMWVPSQESQTEVASRVGGTRQHVNKVMQLWVARRIIAFDKDGVRILNMTALRGEATKSGFELDAYLASGHGSWRARIPTTED